MVVPVLFYSLHRATAQRHNTLLHNALRRHRLFSQLITVKKGPNDQKTALSGMVLRAGNSLIYGVVQENLSPPVRTRFLPNFY